MSEHVRVERDGGVVRLTLDNPPVNIIDLAVMEEMIAELSPLAEDPQLRVLVLQAAGKVFCAGMAVEDHTPENAPKMMEGFEKLFLLLRSTRAATVAAVQGAALGGGFELAMGCDLIVASEKAKFGQPEIQLGFFSPLAAVILPRVLGRPLALEVFYTGEPLRAQRAYEAGIVNRVAPVDEFPAAVDEFVGLIARHSATVIAANKKVTDACETLPFDQALAEARRQFVDELMQLGDVREGLDAFFNKRKAEWKDQ